MNIRAIYVGPYQDFNTGVENILSYGMTGTYNTTTGLFTLDGGREWNLEPVGFLYFPRG